MEHQEFEKDSVNRNVFGLLQIIMSRIADHSNGLDSHRIEDFDIQKDEENK